MIKYTTLTDYVKLALLPLGASAPKTAGRVSLSVYIFLTSRIYKSPLNERRLPKKSRSRPTSYVLEVSYVREVGITVPTEV